MRPLKTYIALFTLIICFGCRPKIHEKAKEHFLVKQLFLKGGVNISSAAYFNGKIFCLKEDDRLIVFDTSLTVDQSLTSRYSTFKIDFLQPINDTVLLEAAKGVYLLDSSFSLKKSDWRPYNYGLPYLNDSTFYVYSWCAGEWGGAVFFLDKRNNKVYSYPSTCVQQVLKFKNNYIVSNSAMGFSGFLSISDPTRLFELKEEIQKTYCNWYVTVDSLKNKRSANISFQIGVKSYLDTFGVKTLTTFPFNDELYSIYSTDSATILAKHKNFKLVTVDTLLKKGIYFYTASTHLAHNFFITAYQASWSVGNGNNKQINHKNSGLIFMQGNSIKFLEFNSY